MELDIINLLKQLYGAADLPVAAADAKLDIIWKNQLAEDSDIFKEASASFLAENEFPNGITSVRIDNDFHLFNIIKYSADEICFIIEYLGPDSSRCVSYMENYFGFLCARIRESAGQITMASDDINSSVKAGDMNVANSLNRINRNVMLLLNEAVVPEQIYYLLSPYCKDAAVNVADEVAVAVSDAEYTFGRNTEVWQNSDNDIYAEINRTVLETVLACMTAACCNGELFPEKLDFRVERIDEGHAFISVHSINLSGKKNITSNLSLLKTADFFTDTFFADLLRTKYGAEFEKINHSDGIECIMKFDILPIQNGIVKSGSKFGIHEQRFSPMAVMLSEKHCSEHYKNIKME
ncbi:MAG: hypothetical protein J6K17_12335 [Oscillospiraceae bacterium]|nr:hypothetical protein [Oscillospiraceae bacterium]